MANQYPQKNNRDGAVQGLKNYYAGNSEYNKTNFMIEMFINNNVATATPVLVQAVQPGGTGNTAGYVDVLPLVCPTDAEGNTIEPATIYHLPYYRLQGGKAAIVIDPEPGDIGLCVFSKQDASNITAGITKPQQPGSFRSFDMADGFYFGCFMGKKPEIFIELRQDNKINIKAAGGINIEGDVTVNGDVIADGISLKQHIHGGVQPGGGTTGRPV